MARRVAQQLAAEGADWPSVAAGARAARGAAKQDLADFAAELDIDIDLLRRVEAGEVDPASVPRALHRRIRLVVGDIRSVHRSPPTKRHDGGSARPTDAP